MPFANIDESGRDLRRDGLIDRARDADAPRRGQRFKPCREIDRHSEKIVLALDHLADRDADAELQPLAGGLCTDLGSSEILDLDSGPCGIECGLERAHDRVAGSIEDPPTVAHDEAVEDVAALRQLPQRSLLILGDQPGEADDVRGKDGGHPAFHGAVPPDVRASEKSGGGTSCSGKKRPLLRHDTS